MVKFMGSVQAAAVERDVRNKAKTVHQMVSELDQKKVSLSPLLTTSLNHSASQCK